MTAPTIAEARAMVRRTPGEGVVFVGGHWRGASGRDAIADMNPDSGERLTEIRSASAEDALEAVEAARAGAPAWRATSSADRATALLRIADELDSRAPAMAGAIALEVGKPIRDALSEARGLSGHFRWNAAEALRLNGVSLPPRAAGHGSEVVFEPVGVVALMTPWNFPAGLVARKLAPALAAGCTAVVKPADEAPTVARLFFEALAAAGLPDGVANLLIGEPRPIAEALCASPDVTKISFTGSTPVGREIYSRCAGTVKRLSLELGGNAPVVVFDDVDAAAVGRLAAARKLANAGQVCVAPNRFLVHQDARRAFETAFAETWEAVVIGAPFDRETTLGPLATERRRDMTERRLAIFGGDIRRFGRVPGNRGYHVRPALVTDPPADSPIMTEEHFAPVAPVTSFADEDEALERANATEMGLAAFVYTADPARAARMRAGLAAGMVGVNTMVLGRVEGPFGGIKQSGFGREGGSWGIRDFCAVKWIESAPAPTSPAEEAP